MKVGTLEIVVIVIVALFVIGPDNLPSYAKKFGEVLKSLRAATADLSKDVQENIVEPLNEAQKPLREALQPLQETVDDVHNNIAAAKESVASAISPRKRATVVTKETLEERKANEWICPNCNSVNHGKFCSECGTPKVTEENKTEQVVQDSTEDKSENKEGATL
ncbi:twin-arginine translocase TatA/TatE family subunit [Solobacterium sp.]|uniref:twin-arginine translocase TatA/TatE family subunit n=1 Tax=Solobacterium sp. TaxID=2060878 RepID=UPI001CB5435D|nr:twin-arginine translocase TatA/TatE family subunit [Solobacterium sp.]MBF1084035.1 twin-arginine translocase TatA/TatE family subunit [Solobacterium sp.]MBF1091863.1 twin-arginine translocase TatA/TatE family subunit [Solobacterium sp.]MBF1099200.1 twin-arginine translocase TatA/TatE family subunit [Solobacterium sp.]